ncbi:phage tail spike protein [Caloranaerobacter azorensis]|uniref:phage tail spike protein n=1 Tax=Caloranaerobacter azorensis TaxID=116090 RepID=UPI00068FF9B7|nr:phage tail spike protein [Caloranaerobacter azorensis]
MIIVYDKKTTKGNFNNNGLAILDECIKAEITEELNGEYSLYIEYPANSKKANFLIEFNIIKADGQLFRIYKIEREQKIIRKIKIWARHIFYDLAFYFIEAVNLLNANMKEALEGTIPPEAQVIFEFKAPEKNIYPVKMRNVNGLEAIFKLIEIYGGELKRNNYQTEIAEKLGETKDIIVKYGKNIKGLRAIIDTNEFATRIYPIGENNLVLPERYIEADSNITNLLPYPITRKIEFQGIKDVEQLRDVAKEYIKKISNPFINIKVDFLELSKTKEYKEYSNLFKLSLGDIVKVKHEKLGIYSELRVIKKVKDLLNPINTKIEFGVPLNTIINKLDFTSIIEKLESKIEGSQNAVIIKKNSEAITISLTSFYQAIAVGISALADTNLTCNLIINGTASSDLTLYMKFSLDGQYYEFQPSQKLSSGENIINLTIPIPQVTAGHHAFVVEMKTSEGTFNIDKNNLQVMIEGRNLEGGLSPSLPRAEVMQFVLYSLFLNKIQSYKNNLKTEVNINNPIDDKLQNLQQISYNEALSKGITNIKTDNKITMKIIRISQKANEDFYLNLITDEWVKHFKELKDMGDGNWKEDNYITIKELKPTTKGEPGTLLGLGAVFTVQFSDPSQYKELENFEVSLVKVGGV